MPRTAQDWRRRLAGRAGFDRDGAESAIRRAYRDSGLPAPELILWARGPREALDFLCFVLRPPGRRRMFGWGLIFGGAALWTILAATTGMTGQEDQPAAGTALVAAVLAFYLVREGARDLPRLPFSPVVAARGAARIPGAAVFLSMMGALLAVQYFGAVANPLARAAEFTLVAGAGCLPGALLLVRVSQAYRDLPEAIREVDPGRSVARALGRTRRRALSRLGGLRVAVRAEEDLVQAYRTAYSDAFLTGRELVAGPGRLDPAVPIDLMEQPGWTEPHAARRTGPFLVGAIAHLDGIRDAELVSAGDHAENAPAAAFADLAYHVDRLYPFRWVALAVEPPTTVSLDADARPHAADGPALAWADGTRVYAWRGRTVDADLVDPAIPLTLQRIGAERDPDRQGILIERFGLGRFMIESVAPEVQADCCGKLYRLEQRGEPVVAVRVVNGTPEPDGSLREFWLRAPPTVQTAREAVAWTFGMGAGEYRALAQS